MGKQTYRRLSKAIAENAAAELRGRATMTKTMQTGLLEAQALETISNAADAHAESSGDPEFAVGDLQLVLAEAFKRLAPHQQDEVLKAAREIIGDEHFITGDRKCAKCNRERHHDPVDGDCNGYEASVGGA